VARNEAHYHYLTCVNRAEGERDAFDLYPRTLKQRLPRIGVPLADDDPDVVLDIQAVLEQTYEKACYADRIDYLAPCVPPLSKEDKAWAERLIKKARGKAPGKRSLRK
jgi:hypothetical protein